MTLAKSGYRVGAVMSLADFDQVQRQVPEPVDVESQQATNPAESILTRFTRQQPAFVVQRTQGGMRLVRQDTPSGVVARLNAAGTVSVDEALPASAALVQVVGTLLSGSPVSGVMGSGPMPAPGCALNTPVRTSASRMSALEALDNIVAQVPALSWFVLYDAEREQTPLYIGLWCGDGMAFRIQLPK